MTLPARDPEFVLEHSGFVRGLAQRLVFDTELARDVEQQTWLAALEYGPPKGASPRNWLATLVRNFAYKAWRGERRREQREQVVAEAQREVPTPAEILERESVRREIVEAVLALDEPWRAALILRFFEELSTHEVARRLSVPHATARTRIKRGLELLRARLEKRRGASGSAWALALVRTWRLEPLSYRVVAAAAAKSLLQGALIVTAAQKVVLGAAAVVVIAASLFVWDKSRTAEPRVAAAPPPMSGEVTLADPGGVTMPESAEREATAEPLAVAATPRVESATCNVFGRAVDERDQPLAGVAVRLAAYKEWAKGIDVPRVPGPYDHHGWDTTTDSAGEFHFTTPVPTAPIASLTLTPDDFHDSALDRFGTSSTDSNLRLPLHAGDNDLGTYRLVATGAVRGRVLDEAGAPIAGAVAAVATSLTNSLSRESTSDALGHYVIGHVRPGSYGVRCQHAGHLTRFEKPFTVEIGRYTEDADFTLATAPSVTGVVVNELGQGIEGARLEGWPKSGGFAARATSVADGSFTMFLPQAEPYTLECTRDGFEPFHLEDRSTFHAPGTAGLRIELKRDVMTKFVVVDATTNEPIERFGIAIQRDVHGKTDDGAWMTLSTLAVPRVADHPGGQLEIGARPGRDTFELTAPGHPSAGGEVAHDSPDSNVQTVRLKAGLSISGRVVFADAPVAGAFVRVEHGGMGSSPGQVPTFQVDLDGAVLTQSSAIDGRFTFTGLAGGMHRLTARAADGAAVVLDPFTLRWDENKDLGDVVLLASGSIAGRVLVPRGRALAGISIHLDDQQSNAHQVTDANGAFRFETVLAGRHSLVVADVPGALAGGDPFQVSVESGAVREVELDLRDRGTCNVDLTLDFGGESAAGVQVTLRGAGKRAVQLGFTDEHGRASGSVPTIGDARVEIYTRSIRFVHPTALLHLQLDVPIDQIVRFDFAKLIVELPPSVALPETAVARVSLHAANSDAFDDFHTSVSLRDGAGSGDDIAFDPSTRRFTFERVPAGDFELTFELSEPRVEATPNGEWRGYRAFYTRTLAVSLAPGADNRTVLQ